MKNGDLSVTSISISMFGHSPISSLKLNASYIGTINLLPVLSLPWSSMSCLDLRTCLIFLCQSYVFFNPYRLTTEIFPLIFLPLFS